MGPFVSNICMCLFGGWSWWNPTKLASEISQQTAFIDWSHNQVGMAQLFLMRPISLLRFPPLALLFPRRKQSNIINIRNTVKYLIKKYPWSIILILQYCHTSAYYSYLRGKQKGCLEYTINRGVWALEHHKVTYCYKERSKMASFLWTVCLIVLFLASGVISAPPKKPIDVPFGRNYVPTWAFDHIKYFNGGSEIQLVLDKYTGWLLLFVSWTCKLRHFFLVISLSCVICDQGLASNQKAPICLVTSACT